jgi:phosphoribosylformylglycinamidine synthase
MSQPTSQILAFSKMSNEELSQALSDNKIGLTIKEARQITDILGRDPSLTEAIIWGIQGSEHCSYKSSRDHLKSLPTEAPHVMIGPGEDAGIVEIANVKCKDGVTRKFGVVMAHESHNHPSQVVPYEGAATGVGGIVRDVLCMGAKVIASGDPLRFGEVERNQTKLISEGVFDGIAGYGNPIGVPNIAGDTYFSDGFNDNCLVNVVCLGLIAEDEIIHSYTPKEAADEGYDIIIIGKPTDNSGMGGASFASLELKEEDKEANKGAVQEPNPFLKRHILESSYDLFKTLKEKGELGRVSFKDMGAGGNVCSTVEQVDHWGYGAEVNVEDIHVGMEGLHASVIACSETQERFAWTCHPSLTKLILDHYNKKWALPDIASNARASVVGKVTHGNYVLKYKDEILCEAKATDITMGLKYDRPYSEPERSFSEPSFDQPDDLSQTLKDLLSSENIASRQPIYERYDKNVQGQSIIESGQADAGLIAPFRNRTDVDEDTQKIGIALSVDSNPRQGKISPYWSAANAVVESMRNVAAIGATPWAATDCLNYGNPEKPEQMWELVEGIRGIGDALRGVKHKIHQEHPVPVVSGNVSLYNESPNGSVDPSGIIGMVGRMDDIDKAITMQFKAAGSQLVLIGKRKNELGASEYYRLMGHLGANVPESDFAQAQKEIYSVVDIIDAGFATSCHDISDGGLAIALMEMAFGGNGKGQFGFEVELDHVATSDLRVDRKLFSETGGFVMEIPTEHLEAAQKIAAEKGADFIKIGQTLKDPTIAFSDDGDTLISGSLADYSHAWLNGLRDKL